MTSQEWKIHKRLLEAAGDGRNIYICSARGQNKTETERRLIEELQAKGKDVVLLSLNDMQTTRTYKPGPVSDFDLLTDVERLERANRMVEAIKEATKKLKGDSKPMYLPEYEMFKDFYVLDEKRESTPYLHWMKTNRYLGYLTGNFEEV